MTAKQNKPQNFVAKHANQFNKNMKHRDKKKDYQRKPKHQKETINDQL
jgi:hypothetical protein